MDIQETLDCMNSDFKLWERAESKDLGGGRVSKTLTLPWGIGEVSVTLEGMTDAGKRREAVGSYGEYIRGLIDEQTNDEAITARAKAAAARPKPEDSSDSLGVGGELGVCDPAVQAEAVSTTDQAHKELTTRPIGLREILTARQANIRDERDYFTRRYNEAVDELEQLDRDLVAVEAGLEALGDE